MTGIIFNSSLAVVRVNGQVDQLNRFFVSPSESVRFVVDASDSIAEDLLSVLSSDDRTIYRSLDNSSNGSIHTLGLEPIHFLGVEFVG